MRRLILYSLCLISGLCSICFADTQRISKAHGLSCFRDTDRIVGQFHFIPLGFSSDSLRFAWIETFTYHRENLVDDKSRPEISQTKFYVTDLLSDKLVTNIEIKPSKNTKDVKVFKFNAVSIHSPFREDVSSELQIATGHILQLGKYLSDFKDSAPLPVIPQKTPIKGAPLLNFQLTSEQLLNCSQGGTILERSSPTSKTRESKRMADNSRDCEAMFLSPDKKRVAIARAGFVSELGDVEFDVIGSNLEKGWVEIKHQPTITPEVRPSKETSKPKVISPPPSLQFSDVDPNDLKAEDEKIPKWKGK